MPMKTITMLLFSSVLFVTSFVTADDKAGAQREYKQYQRQEHYKVRRPDRRETHRRHEDQHFGTRQRPHPGYNDRHRRHDYYYSTPWGHAPRHRYDGKPERPPKYQRYKHKKKGRVIVIPSRRYHRHYIHTRPFHYGYPRYKRLYHDDHFWGWLAFSVLALEIFDHLNDKQQQAHEKAMYHARTSPLGQAIAWQEDTVSGTVTPVWEGRGSSGQFCREYQHEITVDGRTEVAYGSACRGRDGTWEIVQ